MTAGQKEARERFIGDVAGHQMTIAHEDGIYRHVQFRGQRGGHLWFDLLTWPGRLTISGDMGTWTFARVPDMFTFFRSAKLEINTSYWAEKLQHGTSGGRDHAREFSEELFAARLLEQLSSYFGLESPDLETVAAAVKEEVLERESGNGPYALMHAAAEFECEYGEQPEHTPLCRKSRAGYRSTCICGADRTRKTFSFDPCELPDGKEYSYHFLWCLYAIVWGVQQYDAATAAPHQTKEAECPTP